MIPVDPRTSALEPGSELGPLTLAPAEPAAKISRQVEKRVTFLEHPVEYAQSSGQQQQDPCDVCLSTFFVVEDQQHQQHQLQQPRAVYHPQGYPVCSRHPNGPPAPVGCHDDDEPDEYDFAPAAARMDKEPPGGNPRAAGCYRAYEGLKPANNGSASTLKRPPGGPGSAGLGPPVGLDHVAGPGRPPSSGQVRCLCFGGVPDKASRHSFLKGFFINLVICAILVLYTLLGSFIFLYIESQAELPHLAATIPGHSSRRNATWLNQVCNPYCYRSFIIAQILC